MNNFKIEKLSKRITRIIDAADVCCYLVEGDSSAALLDTCCGYGNIADTVHQLTNKEITVILTHGHYDHTGGAALFDNVYMNQADIPVVESQSNGEMRNIDFKNNHFTDKIDLKYIQNPFCGMTLPIKNYQVFDLGNLHIRMIPVPGHTPGMMCPLIIEEHTIIFGDACGM